MMLNPRRHRQFARQGCVVVAQVVSRAWLDAARAEIDRLLAQMPLLDNHRGSRSRFLPATLPESLVGAAPYPPVELRESTQVTGRAGDLLLAHDLLGHNVGGNTS